MRCLHFRAPSQAIEDFSLDFPDDYTVQDVIEIISERESLNSATLTLSFRNSILNHTQLVSTLDCSSDFPLILNTPRPGIDQLMELGYSRLDVETALSITNDIEEAADLLLNSQFSPGDAGSGAIDLVNNILSNPEYLQQLQAGSSLTLPNIDDRLGGASYMVVTPGEVDKFLRSTMGIGLQDFRFGMKIPTDSDLAAEPEYDEITEFFLSRLWHTRLHEISEEQRSWVQVLQNEGIPGTLALKVLVASGYDLNKARKLWSDCS
jgi:hypothetical protein